MTGMKEGWVANWLPGRPCLAAHTPEPREIWVLASRVTRSYPVS